LAGGRGTGINQDGQVAEPRTAGTILNGQWGCGYGQRRCGLRARHRTRCNCLAHDVFGGHEKFVRACATCRASAARACAAASGNASAAEVCMFARTDLDERRRLRPPGPLRVSHQSLQSRLRTQSVVEISPMIFRPSYTHTLKCIWGCVAVCTHLREELWLPVRCTAFSARANGLLALSIPQGPADDRHSLSANHRVRIIVWSQARGLGLPCHPLSRRGSQFLVRLLLTLMIFADSGHPLRC